MNKTIEKLRAICAPHGVEVDASRDSLMGWDITFDAPPLMSWSTTQATVVCWQDPDSIRGIVSFIRSELEDGFYEADDESLRVTGQGKYEDAQ